MRVGPSRGTLTVARRVRGTRTYRAPCPGEDRPTSFTQTILIAPRARLTVVYDGVSAMTHLGGYVGDVA